MSSHLTKAGLLNLAENVPTIAPSEAYEGSNTLSESTPPDEYEGLNWDHVERY